MREGALQEADNGLRYGITVNDEVDDVIYLDWAASAPMYPEALEELCRCAREFCANPGALHAEAGRARAVIQRSRRVIAQLLNVPDCSVYFCSGGTEANNWAVRCGAGREGGHLLIGACEHKSVLESAKYMKSRGYTVTLLYPDALGRYDPDEAEAALRPDTRLISLQAANNETGAIQDVAAFAALAARHGVRFHCDAVQSFGHADLPLNAADMVSLSAHKLGGPRGIGALAVPRGLPPSPLIRGGSQEGGLRAGTEDTAAIAAFAAAAAKACAEAQAEEKKLTLLRSHFKSLLTAAVPGVVFHESTRVLPGILNCAFPGLSGEELLMRLDLMGICVSTGAACAAADGKPSHVLLAMGCSEEEARRSVRFSMGRQTTAEELETAAAAISRIVRERG